MPYISQEDRDKIDWSLFCWVGKIDLKDIVVSLKSLFAYLFANKQPTSGELNYVITTLIHEYIKRKGLCYTTLNEVVGVLSCAKLELYQQIIAPYEVKKSRENGCISELDDNSAERMR